LENNTPPCAILNTIIVKRALLHKIFEEFARENFDSSQMCQEQSKQERTGFCRFYRNSELISLWVLPSFHITQ